MSFGRVILTSASVTAGAREGLAAPAIALESDELREGAAEVHNGTIEHHEDKEREDEDHRDDRQPVLDRRPAPALGSLDYRPRGLRSSKYWLCGLFSISGFGTISSPYRRDGILRV